jgi:hypothetical protein
VWPEALEALVTEFRREHAGCPAGRNSPEALERYLVRCLAQGVGRLTLACGCEFDLTAVREREELAWLRAQLRALDTPRPPP